MFDAAARLPARSVDGGHRLASGASANEAWSGRAQRMPSPPDVGAEVTDGGARARLFSGGREVLTVTTRRLARAQAKLVDGAVHVEERTELVAAWLAQPKGVEQLLRADADAPEVGIDVQLRPGWTLSPVAADPGIVEVLDERGRAQMRMVARSAWDAAGRELRVDVRVDATHVTLRARGGVGPVLIDPLWLSTRSMVAARLDGTATVLGSGRILLAGGDADQIGSGEELDPVLGTFTAALGPMVERRFAATATPLRSGKVLIVGGTFYAGQELATAELYDPETRRFTSTQGALSVKRSKHTATLLPSGRVLIAGGEVTETFNGPTTRLATAEEYDPTTDTFTVVGEMSAPRAYHKATLLPNGRTLFVGGLPSTTVAEEYDPSSRSFVATTGSPSGAYTFPSTASLADGKVLLVGAVAGGPSSTEDVRRAEVYDPSSRTFELLAAPPPASASSFVVPTLLPSGDVLFLSNGHESVFRPATGTFTERVGGLGQSKSGHTVTLLASGRVLIAGGLDKFSTQLASVELYDPELATSETQGGLTEGRMDHTATPLPNGKVLIAGGAPNFAEPLRNAEEYDPATGTFSVRGEMVEGRGKHVAVWLPSTQKVLVVAGVGADKKVLASAEEYDPQTGLFTAVGSLAEARTAPAVATLPSGEVLVAGGRASPSKVLATAELYDPVTRAFTPTLGSMVKPRDGHTATALPSGRVAVIGGRFVGPDVVEEYNPVTQLFEPKGVSIASRVSHTATLLPSGRVFVAGGLNFGAGPGTVPSFKSAEIYDPATGTSTDAGFMFSSRSAHTASLLPSGKVFLAGGAATTTCEEFDPATGEFTNVGKLAKNRKQHASAFVPATGRVLLTGGSALNDAGDRVVPLPSVEQYDPDTTSFVQLVPLANAPLGCTATLMPSGRVVYAGGTDDKKKPIAVVTLLDPEQSSSVSSLVEARDGHTATLLASGQLLVVGGAGAAGVLASAELFDGATSSVVASSLAEARTLHAATTLPDGRVLFLGGQGAGGALASAEVWDPGTRQFSKLGALRAPRSSPRATLMGDGRVLVSGGLRSDGSAARELEMFDPAKRLSLPAGTIATNGGLSAVALPGGDALLATAQGLDEVSLGTELVRAFPVQLFDPIGAIRSSTGDVIACGGERCLGFSQMLPGPTASFSHGFPAGSAFTSSIAGDALLVGGGRVFTRRVLPKGVLRPELGDVPSVVAAGKVATITGAGFRRVSAAGSTGWGNRHPLVFFMPSEGGGPVFGDVLGNADDASLSFRAPHTPYPGPGWLHVVVDGVPSKGRFVTLVAAETGSACASGSECASGHCVGNIERKVCCERACGGGCESCLGVDQGPAGVDGTCKPRAAGTPPSAGCEPLASNPCASKTGMCDGKGGCDYPPPDTACALAPGGPADGFCVTGSCAKAPPSRCSDDGSALIEADGTLRPCAPYTCRSADTPPRCADACVSTSDCQAGSQCGVDGRCRVPPPFGDATDAGACAIGPSSSSHGWSLAWASLLFLLARRSRRAPAGHR